MAKGKGLREGAQKYTETGRNADSMQKGANSWKNGKSPEYAKGIKVGNKSRKEMISQQQSWSNGENSKLDSQFGPRAKSPHSKLPMRGPRP